MRHLGLLLLPVALAGCTTTYVQRVDPVPASAWRAAADSPRTTDPAPRVAARRDPVRPTSSAEPLSREQVLEIANRNDPGDAIAEIDRHPLSFPLSRENLGWFEDRVTPPELVDYLRKRAAVNWEALARTPAPAPAPAPDPEATPSYNYTYDAPAPAPAPQRTTTTVYVEVPPPEPTVVYERPYSDPYFYGGGVIVVGGGYGYRSHYYGAGYNYRSNYNYVPGSLNYRPGAPAGLYVQPSQTVVRTGNPTVVVRSGSYYSSGHHHR